jgi:hypothetical protein
VEGSLDRSSVRQNIFVHVCVARQIDSNPQFVLLRHCTQRSAAVSQYGRIVVTEQSALEMHSTQAPLDALQIRAPASLEQSAADRHRSQTPD